MMRPPFEISPPEILREAPVLIATGAAIAGLAATTVLFPLVAVGAVLGMYFAYACFVHTDACVKIWVWSVALVPVWWAAPLPGFGSIPISAGMGIAVAVALLLRRENAPHPRLSRATLALIIALVATAAISTLFFQLPAFVTREMLLMWLIPAFVGLKFPGDLAPTILRAACFVAAWAVVEFVAGFHIFASFGPTSTWTLIQDRGTFARSEASFGQPIALSSFLVLALPFVSRMRRFQHLTILLLLAGIAVSFSRSGLLGLAATVAAAAYIDRARRGLWLRVAALGGVLAVIMGTALSDQLAEQDTSGSTRYRIDALWRTAGSINPLGLADATYLDPVSRALRFSDVRSIDNAFLLLALTCGVVALIIALLLCGLLVRQFIAGRGGPPTAAVIGQLPILATVALITNWQMLMFVVVGMSARALSQPRDETNSSSQRRLRRFAVSQ